MPSKVLKKKPRNLCYTHYEWKKTIDKICVFGFLDASTRRFCTEKYLIVSFFFFFFSICIYLVTHIPSLLCVKCSFVLFEYISVQERVWSSGVLTPLFLSLGENTDLQCPRYLGDLSDGRRCLTLELECRLTFKVETNSTYLGS